MGFWVVCWVARGGARQLAAARHTISSLLGWSSETQALPPLALSVQHASLGDGHSDGEVHHQPAIFQDSPLFDVHFTLQWRDLSWAVYLCAQY